MHLPPPLKTPLRLLGDHLITPGKSHKLASRCSKMKREQNRVLGGETKRALKRVIRRDSARALVRRLRRQGKRLFSFVFFFSTFLALSSSLTDRGWGT